jgi:2-dehydro-3-deoxyphosphogluconate aldolase/(4S)-4-hydroxy-2-oxoglutarate aldolase
MSILSQLLQHKIIAIVRGAQPEDVLSIANALYNGGVRAVEITLNSVDALAVIRELSDGLKNKMLVGAGTVLDAASAAQAIKAGAQFIISPSLDQVYQGNGHG